jgi:DNA-binding HxlR family transcriptional regulator
MEKKRQECPIEKVVELLGDSCSILIIRDLLGAPKRFGELEESLSVSSRTLAKKLKLLEHEHIVIRKEHSAHANYQLTKKGAAFHEVADAMRVYGKKYL